MTLRAITPLITYQDLNTDLDELAFNVKAAPFNAVGDGAANDSPAIQSAIDAANAQGGGTVFFPEGTYKLGTNLNLRSNVHLLGAPGAWLDMSTTTKVGSYRYGIRALGSVNAPVVLSANAVKGQFSVTVSSASSLAIGDWVLIATEGVNFYPYTVDTDRGEYKQIINIVGNVLTFEQALYDNYTTANGAFVRKITWVENIAVVGLGIRGNNIAGDFGKAMELTRCNGVRVSGCVIENVDTYLISIDSSIRADVEGNRLRGVNYTGVGSAFYAVAVINSSQWIRVRGNHAERVRHLYVNTADSSGQGRWGCPRFVTVTGNVAQNMEISGSPSWAFEHHGVGEHIEITGNVADGCYGGFVTRGAGVRFENNIIRNWTQHAIEIHLDTQDARDISIKNNTISGFVGTAVNARAVRIALDSMTTCRNVVIANNEIEFTDGIGQAVVTEGTPLLSGYEGLVIEGNTITSLVAMTVFPMQITAPQAVIKRNRFINTAFGISAAGGAQDIIENEIWNNGVSGTSVGISTDQANCRVLRNSTRLCATGIRLAVGAVGTSMIGNVDTASTTSFNVLETSPGRVENNIRTATAAYQTAGDTSITLSVFSSAEVTKFATNLTANRTVTLSTTNAARGAKFRVIRTAGGAFNLDVGSGPLKTLATNQWCDVVFDGTAWNLAAFGSL